jgi:hypothetical protein
VQSTARSPRQEAGAIVHGLPPLGLGQDAARAAFPVYRYNMMVPHAGGAVDMAAGRHDDLMQIPARREYNM